MKKEWLIKTLALGIVVLFISISFQPIIAENTISVGKESDYENADFEQAKEYLFQTLIDISNNLEVKEFLNEHRQNLITNDYNCKNAVQKILLQKPRLLMSILFTKPEMTIRYLETSFNRGLEIVDILGEEESSKIAESVSVTNSEVFNELKNIIKNEKELSNRISILEKMNNNLKFNLGFSDYTIICSLLIILFISIFPIFFLYILLDEMEKFADLWNLQLIRIILRFFEFLTQIFIFPVIFLLYRFCID